MYVILRKPGEKILVDSQPLVVSRVDGKDVLLKHGESSFFDFPEGGSFPLSENIEVKAVRVGGSTARIGIAAPREIPILRC